MLPLPGAGSGAPSPLSLLSQLAGGEPAVPAESPAGFELTLLAMLGLGAATETFLKPL